MAVKIIKINVRAGDAGLFHATSPDLPGLRVTEKSRQQLFVEIPRVVEAFYKATGRDVAVHQVEGHNADDLWAVVPK